MDREQTRRIIEACYAARQAGDAARLDELFADDARYEVIGAQNLIESYPGANQANIRAATEQIMSLIEMRSAEPVAMAIDGKHVAVRLRTTISFAGREPFETELTHWWQLRDDGQVVSLTEFLDTARMAEELEAAA